METKKNGLPPELEDTIGSLSPGIPENVLGDNLAGVSELTENWAKAIDMDSISLRSTQLEDIATGLKEFGHEMTGLSQELDI